MEFKCRRSVGFGGAKLISSFFVEIFFFVVLSFGKDAWNDKGTLALHSLIRTLGASCDSSA